MISCSHGSVSRVVATGLWPVHVGAFLFKLGRRPTGSWLPFYFESLEVFYSDTNGNCYVHAYTYCNSDIYSNANGNCYSHSHSYGHSYGYANSNGASSNACGAAEADTDATAATDAGASSVACRTNWNR